MTSQEMRRALIAFQMGLDNGEPLDKPRASSKAGARGAKAKLSHVQEIMDSLRPLLMARRNDLARILGPILGAKKKAG